MSVRAILGLGVFAAMYAGTARADEIIPQATSGRSWRPFAATMLGIRGDQGGLVSSGYRIGGLVGVLMSPVSLTLALDHQIGDDQRIAGHAADPVRHAEWLASARVGWALPIGPDFWVQVSGGAARVNNRLTRVANMHTSERASFGFDATATIVWRSGLIASTLVVGATAVPSDHEILVDNETFVIPARIEPWFGLGAALVF